MKPLFLMAAKDTGKIGEKAMAIGFVFWYYVCW